MTLTRKCRKCDCPKFVRDRYSKVLCGNCEHSESEHSIPMTLTGRTRNAQVRRTRKAVLVYQAGIANVFAVDCFNLNPFGRNAKRLLQGAFSSCEWFAKGLAAAGVKVATVHCNMAGDITNQIWSEDLDSAPFRESFHPVFAGVQSPIETDSL